MDRKIDNQIKKFTHSNINTSYLQNFDENLDITQLKKELIKYFSISISIDRLGLSYINQKDTEKHYFENMEKPLKDYKDFTADSVITMKDLGAQISRKLVYTLEYIGPLIIISYKYFDLFTEVDEITYGQHALFFANLFHFARRIYESNYVHIFSKRTMPLICLFINCFYYWILYACLCGHYIFNSDYKDYFKSNKIKFFATLFYIKSEMKNMNCHSILRRIKYFKKGEKDIPKGEGFEIITCANYFWEFLSWCLLCVIAFHWSIVLFTCCGFFIMRSWALKKHNKLKKLHKDYEKDRFAFIPGIA